MIAYIQRIKGQGKYVKVEESEMQLEAFCRDRTLTKNLPRTPYQTDSESDSDSDLGGVLVPLESLQLHDAKRNSNKSNMDIDSDDVLKTFDMNWHNRGPSPAEHTGATRGVGASSNPEQNPFAGLPYRAKRKPTEQEMAHRLPLAHFAYVDGNQENEELHGGTHLVPKGDLVDI